MAYAGTHDYSESLFILSGLAREYSHRNDRLVITTDNLDDLILESGAPLPISEQFDRLLRHIHERQGRPDAFVLIDEHEDYPVVYGRDSEEIRYLINQAIQRELLEREINGPELRLTVNGWVRVEELLTSRPDSNQAFVVMWFDPSMLSSWTDGFVPALRETGFQPIRADQTEHNDKIDDRIIADIRRSGLVVVDYTGHRGGVYYEAGFARGLDIPVISMCKSDHFKDLHFDVRQYNTIEWSNVSDLRDKLIARIEATMPNRSRVRP
jgi:hypothetical protein